MIQIKFGRFAESVASIEHVGSRAINNNRVCRIIGIFVWWGVCAIRYGIGSERRTVVPSQTASSVTLS